MTRRWHGIAAAALLPLVAVAQAGTVDVSYRAEQSFADAGPSTWERKDNLEAIARHLRSLGDRLPADQRLQVELVDVDLAGHPEPSRTGRDLRIARGGADWPRITLRYTLTGADGRTLRSGEERVQDMSYLDRLPATSPADPLGHEKRMLDEWFRYRFGGTTSASGTSAGG